MNDTDLAVVEAMEKYGGSFVKALAACAHRADPKNLAKLKLAFADYWFEYDEMAKNAPPF